MKSFGAAFPALAAASAAPAAAFALYCAVSTGATDLGFFFMCAFVVSAAHVLILGVPASLLLYKAGHLRFIPLVLVGAAIGATPVGAMVVWSGSSSGLVSDLLGIGAAGLFGVIGAASFYLALPNQ